MKIQKSQQENKNIIEINNKKYFIDSETGELFEVFLDFSASGRENPWRQKKIENCTVEKIYRSIASKYSDLPYWVNRADKLHDCSNFILFNRYERGIKVTNSNLCRVRLCPLCSWRRSLKVHAQTLKILNAMQSENNYNYIMVTFTIPNVCGADLSSSIDHLFQSWNRLQRYSLYKNAVLGYYRALEVTHNVNKFSSSYDTYHPHFHCIFAVKSNYFTSKNYINHSDWINMWRKSTRDSRITQVDVRKIKPKKGCNDVTAAVCEVAKYSVKSDDYIFPWDWNLSCDTVEILDSALYKRRLVAFGGIMKEFHKKLNLDDAIDGDLFVFDSDDLDYGELLSENCLSFWHSGYQQYFIK